MSVWSEWISSAVDRITVGDLDELVQARSQAKVSAAVSERGIRGTI
jgi:hypothetical protein